MYTKRNKAPKSWPITRKGTKFVSTPSHNPKSAISLITVTRDILKILETNRELKKLLNEKQIMINGRLIRESNYPINLFDTISFLASKKHYRAVLSENKKFSFVEVSEKETQTKTFRIIGKKEIGKKKTQINLMEGFNVISNEKVNVGDSVVVNLKDKKITKVLPLEKGKNIYVFSGKHIGNKGKIKEITNKGDKSIATITSEKNGEVMVWVKNLIAIE